MASLNGCDFSGGEGSEKTGCCGGFDCDDRGGWGVGGGLVVHGYGLRPGTYSAGGYGVGYRGDVHGFELVVCFGEHGCVAFYYPLLPVSLPF